MRSSRPQEISTTDNAVYAARKTWAARACRTVHESPLMAPFQSRTGRHRLVGLFLVVLAAFPVLGWVTDRSWLVALAMIPFAALSVLLAVATQGMLDKPLSSLDERQAMLRQNLFREPYITGVSLGLAGGLIVAVAARLNEATMLGLVLVVLGFVFILPSMVLAWRLPDDVDDDG